MEPANNLAQAIADLTTKKLSGPSESDIVGSGDNQSPTGVMLPATPYTSCANGCGVPAQWKVKKNGRTKNLCNTCTTKSHDRSKQPAQATRTNAESKRKAEVLDRLGYSRRRNY